MGPNFFKVIKGSAPSPCISNRPVACKTSGIFNYVMSLLDYYVAPPTNTFPIGENSSSQLNL